MAPVEQPQGLPPLQLHPILANLRNRAQEELSNARDAVRSWADKHQLVQPNATRRNGKDCHRQAPLPGAWNMSKNAGKWPAGAAVAISPLRAGCFAAMIPGDSAAEAVITSGLYNFLNIYNNIILVRLVLTWFPNPPQQIVGPLSTIVDPYLNLFRGIIPPIGGTLDLSPILAFVVLNVFTGTAAALPCEMPKDGDNRPLLRTGPSAAAQKYALRMQASMRRRLGMDAAPAQE